MQLYSIQLYIYTPYYDNTKIVSLVIDAIFSLVVVYFFQYFLLAKNMGISQYTVVQVHIPTPYDDNTKIDSHSTTQVGSIDQSAKAKNEAQLSEDMETLRGCFAFPCYRTKANRCWHSECPLNSLRHSISRPSNQDHFGIEEKKS